MMVQSGMTGVPDPLDGEVNFFKANYHQGDIKKAFAGLGKPYEITRTNIKRWSVGSPIQAPLDGLLELIRANHVTADQVESLTVRVAHQGANPTDNRHMPDICMQHMCAVMLLDGIVTFESAHDEKRMKDPKVLAVRRRVTLLGDDEMAAAMPARQCRLALKLKDGRELTIHVKGSGKVTSIPVGIDCGLYCSQSFSRSSPIVLEAVPGSNGSFIKWQGACTGTSPTCTLKLKGITKSAKALFR